MKRKDGCHKVKCLNLFFSFCLLRTEHEKRSPNCEFIKTKKDFSELTVAEYCHMEKERVKIYIVSVHSAFCRLWSMTCGLNTGDFVPCYAFHFDSSRERFVTKRWQICRRR